MKRYTIGFTDSDTKSVITEEYPDLIPIVDNGSRFMCGEVIAFAVDEFHANQIVNRLNVMHDFEKTWTSLP